MKKVVLWAVLPCLLLAGCTEEAQKGKATVPPRVAMFTGTTPQDQVKNTIMRYNQLLVFGYEHLDMNPLQEVATVRQAEKAYHHMAAIGEGGVKMTSRIKNAEFIRIVFPSAGKADVKTRETWDFAYNNIETGVKKEEIKDFTYLMDYRLEQQDGRWIITDILAAEETPADRAASAQSAKQAAPDAARKR